MFDSVRTRLTLALAVLTALASSAAVYYGTQFIEADLADTALEDSIARYVDESGSFYPWGIDEALSLEEALLLDGAVFSGEPAFAMPQELMEALTELEAVDGPGFLAPDDDEMFETQEAIADFAGQYEIRLLDAAITRLDRSDFVPTLMTVMGRSADDPIDVALSNGIPSFDFTDDIASLWFEVVEYNPSLGLDATRRPPGSQLVIPADEFFQLGDWIADHPGEADDVGLANLRFREVATAEGWTVGVFADIGERARSLDEMRSALWVAAVALTALATLATWLLTGRALSPVAAITARVGEISAGNLDERVPVPKTRDEVNELATTMNGMLDRIETDDRKRRQFVSDASHELRTPVAVLKSEAEVALRTPATTDVAVLANVVLAESDRMGSMVEDLLTLARADENGHSAERSTELRASAIADLDEVVLADAQRQRSLPVDLSEVSAGRVRGSSEELSRVVTHLLDNACRHGRSRVGVGLRESLDQSVVELWVDDDGHGLAASDRERVFERFVRLDEARNRDGGGAGLGLAVVRSTVTKLGGTVEVLDSPLGGARFLVRLPVA